MGRDRFGLWAEIILTGVNQRMRWIPPGRFTMGSPGDEPGRLRSEGPLHKVCINEGFWLFDTPVTQALWQAVMRENPSYFQSLERPVEHVSWDDSNKFLEKLNELMPGLDLSLPSEAQWEYACRAGEQSAIYAGEFEIVGERNAPALDPIAWYSGNSGEAFELENGYDSSGWAEKQYPSNKSGTHLVKGKLPNAWGLYDMLGNVWEWTADAWHGNYEASPADGSVWESDESGAGRVIRGGSWSNKARRCRSACRVRNFPDNRYNNLGFRPARVQS
ncbi:MAG: formylglycine-generating enzyme family protein [Rhodobacteraceae bacterium]|nr:formylglycine-generating enzyme family protein [Paracoccaceae bacterium]